MKFLLDSEFAVPFGNFFCVHCTSTHLDGWGDTRQCLGPQEHEVSVPLGRVVQLVHLS